MGWLYKIRFTIGGELKKDWMEKKEKVTRGRSESVELEVKLRKDGVKKIFSALYEHFLKKIC